MIFEWDGNKNRQNIKKHGIDFKHAVRVFEDPNKLLRLDNEESEERWDILGRAGGVIFLVFTERIGGCIRIISARKATRREADEYYKGYFR